MDKKKLRLSLKIGLPILAAIAAISFFIENKYVVALLWILAVILILTWGNQLIYRKLDDVHPWQNHPLKRFFIQLSFSGIYSLSCINFTYYFLKTLFLGMPPNGEQFIVLNLYGLLFIVPVISLTFGFYFMIRWKKAFIQSEKLREENIRSRFASLKNHIDPHFLFNNLNALSSLIEKDPGEAQQFLEKFADVYRYVLQHRDEELVELNTELTFIKSYLFLFQRRLDRQLRVSISCMPSENNFYIPPLSIQMLVENAIKHNMASVDRPLLISIEILDQKWLVVQNTLQPKSHAPNGLEKTGLENILKRLSYFSDDQMIVEKDSDYFTVKLPLLRMEQLKESFPDVIKITGENKIH